MTKQETKTAKARARAIRVSPRKLNLLAGSIRGLKADKALAQLTFSKKRVSEEVKKVLQSAIANAENNFGMDVDNLIVSEAFVGKAMVMKRFAAAAKGRACRIIKPFSNLTIIVAEQEKTVAKSEKSAKIASTKKTTKQVSNEKENI
ncbi:MAG: 50S ribosomal protein L22 [Alphaproteobacteria bacterium]